MKKKIVSLLMCATLLAGMFAGCGSSGTGAGTGTGTGDSQTNAPVEGGEVTNITIMIPTMGEAPVDMDKVVAAMNEITEKEIGVHADYIISSGTTYAQSVQMKMTSGEELDIIQAQGIDFNSAITQNQFMNLDELMAEYGKDLSTAIPQMYLDGCKYNGSQYLIPVVRGCSDQQIILVREDLAELAGWDIDRLGTIKTAEDFGNLLADVHEKFPDIITFSPIAVGVNGPSLSPINGLGSSTVIDPLSDCLGVIQGDSTSLINYFASEEFKNLCEITRDWYNKGYVWKEALTSSTNAIDTYLFAGNLFAVAFSSASDNEMPWKQPESFIFANSPTINLPISRALVTTSTIANNALAIPTTSKNAAAAMKYLNYFYNSPELENLLCRGIEGEHYSVNEDGLVVPTELGQSNYTQSFNMYLGNQALLKDDVENGPDFYKNGIETSINAAHTPALGYHADLSANSVESVAITNICSEYLGGLLLGSVDTETQLAKFLEELDGAGIQTIIDVKQQQLNEFFSK